MAAITIRPALPDEIDEVIAIDDDACALFDTVGLHFDLDAEHPFARAEHARWLVAACDGRAFLAVSPAAVGLLVLSVVDGVRYVDQLSVRRRAMRRGVGRSLLKHAIEWANGEALWLTTYSHVPWNRAFYEQAGFTAMPEPECPAGVVADLDEQRRWLPAPGQRIAMCRRGGAIDLRGLAVQRA